MAFERCNQGEISQSLSRGATKGRSLSLSQWLSRGATKGAFERCNEGEISQGLSKFTGPKPSREGITKRCSGSLTPMMTCMHTQINYCKSQRAALGFVDGVALQHRAHCLQIQELSVAHLFHLPWKIFQNTKTTTSIHFTMVPANPA